MAIRRFVALLLVLVLLSSIADPAMAAQPEIHKKSKTLTVVQVNDVLITLRSNKDLTKSASNVIVQLAPVAAGVAIGAYVDGVVGAVAGAVLGLVLGGATSYALLDEKGCIWFWCSKIWGWTVIPVYPYIQYLPKYFRIASYTLWDSLGIGNP